MKKPREIREDLRPAFGNASVGIPQFIARQGLYPLRDGCWPENRLDQRKLTISIGIVAASAGSQVLTDRREQAMPQIGA